MKRYFSEAIGTFCLVFAGTGAIVVDDLSGGSVSHVGVSLTFGLVVMAMIYAVGETSGAHLNPAVTIGFCVARRFPATAAFPYIASQLIGALAASSVLWALFSHESLGTTKPMGGAWQAFVLEVVLTAMLMFVILGVATEKGILAGVAIGGVIAFEALFAGPISGASMNPARSLAPALISGNLHDIWIYIAAPIVGASVGVLAHKGTA